MNISFQAAGWTEKKQSEDINLGSCEDFKVNLLR